jgi:hypothetical protein
LPAHEPALPDRAGLPHGPPIDLTLPRLVFQDPSRYLQKSLNGAALNCVCPVDAAQGFTPRPSSQASFDYPIYGADRFGPSAKSIGVLRSAKATARIPFSGQLGQTLPRDDFETDGISRVVNLSGPAAFNLE